MTWNVENLFRPGAPAGLPSQAVFEQKLDGLAAVIESQSPDALAVQEIGDPDALDDLIARLTGTWHQRVSSHPDRRGIRVAWLTRAPISAPEDITDFPPPLGPVQSDDQGGSEAATGRGVLAVTVKHGGSDVRLVTAHLKSKLLTFPGGVFQPTDEDERARFGAYALYRRTAEAATVRVAVSAMLGNAGDTRALVVTGDLNDTPEAATTQLLLGPPGSEIGTPGFAQPDHGDRQRLWNLAPLMPPGKDHSRVNHGRPELIDHILVSAALVHKSPSAEAVIEQPLPSVTNDPTARHGAPSSDHAPVVATFDV
ncbi:MAG TPA: endonuclease/exonuclease/phosphatase family protein [Thermoleophilaceae bacterium]|nr:endonuclease/exonuclease/phosphatase family protein [Thermoleophilaceae bacterium]